MRQNEDWDNFDDQDELDEEERQRIIRRRQRIEKMRREKRRYMLRLRILKIGIPTILVAVLLFFAVGRYLDIQKEREERNKSWQPSEKRDLIELQKESEKQLEDAKKEAEKWAKEQEAEETGADGLDSISDMPAAGSYHAAEADELKNISEEVVSTAAVVIDRETETILAQRDAKTRINPASMTKILTVLVAAEHVSNLDDTFTITREITDYGYVNDCSSVGFSDGEEVSVRDLFYGTILPSGADAAVGLAIYVAGSQEAFVEMMNEKLKEMGLSETSHMTNCVGIFNDDHYSTAYDIAMILEAAVDIPLCREVLSEHIYTTSKTEQHPEGITVSNWFLRRIEDKETGGEVVCAKTGYVVQSGSCAASYSENESGQRIICVTAGSTSSWRCIYDHVAIYNQFMK